MERYVHIDQLFCFRYSACLPQPFSGIEMVGMSDAFIEVEQGKIVRLGAGANLSASELEQGISMKGYSAIPAFCDSHTHIVYAGSREGEFVDKINGLSYEEIARRGGGILNSAARLQQTSEQKLFEQSLPRAWEMMHMGTGAIEIKSGYGLTVADELKMLRVARRIQQEIPALVKTTLLGAHALPLAYKENRSHFIQLVVNEMIPNAAAEGLADYVDVFCDRGFFTVEETDTILNAAAKYGLRPKIHANELDYSGGIQVGVKHRAVSVDHLEYTGPEEMQALLHSGTMPTLLPSTAFFLRLKLPPAREMIEYGLPLALASDYNPGSSPSGNMPFVLSLACIQLRMLPEEALVAATLNGACAMELQEQVGNIAPGHWANIAWVKDLPSLAFLPYAFGSKLITKVMLKGRMI